MQKVLGKEMEREVVKKNLGRFRISFTRFPIPDYLEIFNLGLFRFTTQSASIHVDLAIQSMADFSFQFQQTLLSENC